MRTNETVKRIIEQINISLREEIVNNRLGGKVYVKIA